MFHQALAATLFSVRAQSPSFSPLLQLPNRSETAGEGVPIAPQNLKKSFLYFIKSSWGKTPKPPICSLRCSRCWKKFGRPAVPPGASSDTAQRASPEPVSQPVVAVAEPPRNRRDSCVHPSVIAVSRGA